MVKLRKISHQSLDPQITDQILVVTSDPTGLPEGAVFFNSATGLLKIMIAGVATLIATGAAAPLNALYVTGTANSTLTNELVLATAVIMRGTAASRPAASDLAGALYYATDTSVLSRSNGITWDTLAPAGGTPAAHATTHQPGGTDAMAVDAAAATGSLRTLGTGAAQAAAGNDSRFTDSRAPTAHALEGALHTTSGGTDGYGLRQTGASAFAWEAEYASIAFHLGDGTNAIVAATEPDQWVEVPFDAVIVSARLGADASGSIVLDLWRDTYANYPPDVGDTITASAKPTLSSALKAEDTTLTGWSTTLTRGQWLRVHVDSAATCKRVVLSLGLRKT